MRLVAVTRILNEDDIVEAFVRHHATMVDHHLFLDNGSTDRTLEILRSLQTEGIKLTVLQNNAPFYVEFGYNTNLFKQARQMFAADWVLFLDTDEFIDAHQVPGGPRGLMEGLPAEIQCLAIPMFNYLDLPADNQQELIIPVRMRIRERAPQPPVTKIFLRGELADRGALIEGGQHEARLNGDRVPSYSDHGLTIAHYFRRSAWQIASKAVLGHLKVVAAGKQERDNHRSEHYDELYESMRDNPEHALRDAFIHPTYGWLDLVEEPLPYQGGVLRYTQHSNPVFKAIRVLISYTEQLAEQHGLLIDTNEAIRLQTTHTALLWTHLF